MRRHFRYGTRIFSGITSLGLLGLILSGPGAAVQAEEGTTVTPPPGPAFLAGFRITYVDFFKVGLLATIVTIAIGSVWLFIHFW